MLTKHRVVSLIIVTAITILTVMATPASINAASPFTSQGQSERFLLPIYTYDEASKNALCGKSESFLLDSLRTLCRATNGTGEAMCPSTVHTAVCLTKDGTLQNSTSLLIEYSNIVTAKNIVDVPLLAADSLYQEKPTSGIVYAEDMFNKITNPGKVYAAGTATPYYPGLGFNLLTPVRSIWGWSVNFVYSFMIIIILGIAFSLLFQNALSGKQVVQLTSAIPNVIIAMVLIPLSYPICGFAIDFLALGANLVHGVMLSGNTAIARQFYDKNELKIQTGGGIGLFQLFGATPTGTTPDKITDSTNRGLYIDDERISVWRAFTLIDTSDLGDILGGQQGLKTNICNIGAIQYIADEAQKGGPDAARAQGLLDQIEKAQTLDEINTIIEGSGANTHRGAGCTILTIVDAITGILGQLVQSQNNSPSGLYTVDNLLGDLLYIVLTISAFFTTFRIFVALFIKYVAYFLLMPMISPFVFASIAIPGQGTKGIMYLVKRMYGTAVIFIVVYAAFMLAVILSQGNILTVDQTVTNKFVPPLLGLGGSNVVSTTATNIGLSFQGILDLAALGIFFAVPSIIKYFEDLFGLKIQLPTFIKWSISGIGAGLGMGAGFARRSVGTVQNAFESARAADEKIFELRQKVGTSITKYRDQQILASQGIGAVTRTQKLDDAYKSRLRILSAEREKIENDAGMSSALKAVRLANVNRQINSVQNQAKINLGDEVKIVLAKKVSPTFVGPGGTRGTATGFRTNVNALNDRGKIIINADTQDANRIFGEVAFAEGPPTPDKGGKNPTNILKVYFGGVVNPQDFQAKYATNSRSGLDFTGYTPERLRQELYVEVELGGLNSSNIFDFGEKGKPGGEGGSEIPFAARLSDLAQRIISEKKIDMTFNSNPDLQGTQYKYTVIFRAPGATPVMIPYNLAITVGGRTSSIISGG